jgi:hypothetical protein
MIAESVGHSVVFQSKDNQLREDLISAVRAEELDKIVQPCGQD